MNYKGGEEKKREEKRIEYMKRRSGGCKLMVGKLSRGKEKRKGAATTTNGSF